MHEAEKERLVKVHSTDSKLTNANLPGPLQCLFDLGITPMFMVGTSSSRPNAEALGKLTKQYDCSTPTGK